jgi:hypothetical protein
MTKFITGKELEQSIYDIIWDAKKTLLILCPYIKLDQYFKNLFDRHSNNPAVHIIIVFGKNENDVRKSLSKDDLDYFKKFPNISVVYVPDLHAKYYANESAGVITSINLHDASFQKNIEFGVYSETPLIASLGSNADKAAWEKSSEIAFKNEVVFIKRPVFEKKLLSALLGKSYVKSDVLFDNTQKFYRGLGGSNQENGLKKLGDFPMELELGARPTERPVREEKREEKRETRSNDRSHYTSGFCIRTGEPIPYNPNRPLSDNAYRSWVQYENYDYPENYCHKTGKPSYGKTSMRNPVLGGG